MEDVQGCTVPWDADVGVARTQWLPGSVCGIEGARAGNAEILGLGHGKVLPLVVASPSSRMLANFFLGLKRGAIPVKMFTAEPDAVAWLHVQR